MTSLFMCVGFYLLYSKYMIICLCWHKGYLMICKTLSKHHHIRLVYIYFPSTFLTTDIIFMEHKPACFILSKKI